MRHLAIKIGLFIFLILTLVYFSTVLRKMHDIRNDPEKVIAEIEFFFSKFSQPIDHKIESRIQKAINGWKNNQVDKCPILFFATISKPKDKNQNVLYIAFSDEDANLLGIGIKEEKTVGGVQTVVEERYPLYIEQSQPAFWTAILQISERTDGQTKDETAWSFYMRSHAGFSIFKEKYPTIWVSFPAEDTVTEVFVYDKD